MLLFCYKTGYISDAGGKKVVSLQPLNGSSRKTYLGEKEYAELQRKECVESTDMSARLAACLIAPK